VCAIFADSKGKLSLLVTIRSTPEGMSEVDAALSPPWRQPRGQWMVSLVNSHTNATRIGWHLWEIDLRFSPGLAPFKSNATLEVTHILNAALDTLDTRARLQTLFLIPTPLFRPSSSFRPSYSDPLVPTFLFLVFRPSYFSFRPSYSRHHILNAALNTLDKRGLANASRLVLAGNSAGGQIEDVA